MKADIILGVLLGQYELAKETFLADPEVCDYVLQWARERHADSQRDRRYKVEAVRRDGDQFVLTLTDLTMPPASMETRESVVDFYAIFRHMVLNLTEGVA